ncbi:restriction endonuclease [Verrucomicrobiaceae bacterium 5K15]|uniref:Restriction endonuclease n=1 Tax=Oceaniferula flava TaxID=2800421 RepID=A0AAE2V9F1_9BACT|nr:restriction endonuclease [Oceaniferula flavus]MBK1854998.1 restriction endonuclease [Oceaniferula flavus]MBM1136304.1 restriction endonuclease [Oceaniferula flavus]
MTIPTYQEFMLPVLQVLEKAPEPLHHKEFCEGACDLLGVPDDVRKEMLPAGGQTYVYNRTGWASWYMQQAGLVEKPKRAYLKITDAGRELLKTKPQSIDNKLLANYPSFVEKVIKKKPENKPVPDGAGDTEQTPDEQIITAFKDLNDTLADNLRETMATMSPYRFEQLVVDLLFAMGYGGSREEAATVTQKSNDGGIDGIINEDRLGLDVIYIQAKRYQSTIGSKEIQSFVGALAGKQANKGVFITTSDYSRAALSYAETVTQKVILINGSRLADLMIEHNIGVSTQRTIAIKRIDTDYFEEN